MIPKTRKANEPRAFGNGGGEAEESGDPFASTADRTGRGANTASARPADPTISPAQRPAEPRSGPDLTSQTAQGREMNGRVSADEVNNAVVIYALPRDYAVIEEALRKLDVPPVQVMIEAAITEVTLNETLRYGVQWNWLTGDSSFRVADGASVPTAPGLPGFSYFVAGQSIRAALNALEQRTHVKVVSAPKLVTLNNQTAALQVGDQVPVSAGNAVSVQNPQAPIVNSIEYRDTGVILKVTPRVNAGGAVQLDVSQEVSDVSTNGTSGAEQATPSPTISTRRIATTVSVQDGQVIALGGLFRDARSSGKHGLPLLSRLPVLGSLFGSHNSMEARTELIVLLKPHVIRTPDDGREVTEELRAKLRTLEPFWTQGKIP